MKILLKKDELIKYFDARKDSELADEIFNELYFGLAPEDTKVIKRFHKVQNFSLCKSYKKHISTLLDPESNELYNYLFKDFGFNEIVILDRKKYEDNPYYQLLLKIKDFKKGNIEFKQNKVPSYVPVAINEKRYETKNYFRDITPTGIFEEDFYFPAIIQNEVTWMSFAPHETETSEEAIKNATGDVVTYGCGLGYFPYMASLKDDVTSVTIVELDPKIIKFFEENLLPLFEHKEKIRIVNANAVEFHKNPPMKFNYLFADIWHDVFDGLPFYLIFKKDEKVADKCEHWIEKDMLAYFRRNVVSLMEEEYLGYTDRDYQVKETFVDKLLSTLHFHLKNKVIKNAAELEYFLSDEGLKELIKELPELN